MAIEFIDSAFAGSAVATTNPSITHELTVQTADVLIALLSNSSISVNGDYTSDSNLFSLTYNWNQGSTTIGQGFVFARIVTDAGSEPAAYAWTCGVAYAYSLHVFQFRGVHSDIWDVTPAAGTTTVGTTGGAGAITAPSIDIVTSGAMGLLMATVVSSSAALSSPTNSYGDLIVYTSGRCQGMARRASLSTGATGTSAMTMNAADDYAICQAALKAAADPPPGFTGLRVTRHI